MKKIFFAFLIFQLLFSYSIAAELAGVSWPDQDSVDGKNLTLNGVALRKVTKFGFPIKVYVGALYLPQKTKDSKQVIEMQGPKKIGMHFLLSVDRQNLIDTFDGSYKGNCFAACEKKSDQFALIKQHLVSVRKDDKMLFTVMKDKVIFEVIGANAKKVELLGAEYAQNIVAMFVNDKTPPSPELRKGLLGLE